MKLLLLQWNTFFLLSLLWINNVQGQTTDCIDGQAPKHQMAWKNSGQVSHSHRPHFPKASLPPVSARMDQMAKLLMQAYPQPKGLECHIRREVDGEGDHDEYKASLSGKASPFRYSVEGWFFTLHCDTKTGQVKREGETGTTLELHVNWLHRFMKPIDGEYSELTIANGQQMYFMPYVVGELKGYPVYSTQQLTWDKRAQESVINANRPEESIILTADGKLPVRPVSKEEYLQALLRLQKKMVQETEKKRKELDAILAESLTSYDKMSFSSATDREKAKTGARRDAEKGRSFMAKELERYTSAISSLQAIIENLSPDEKKEQVFLEEATGILDRPDMKAALKNQEKKGRPIVTHDFSYTDPKLPRHAIQYIQVFFKYETLSRLLAKPDMIKQVKETIDLDALKAQVEKKVGVRP